MVTATQRRRKIICPPVPMAVRDAVDQRWSMDFVSDQLANGRRFRVLNIVDDFSREYVHQIVDFSISGRRLARELDQLTRSLPRTVFDRLGLVSVLDTVRRLQCVS